MVWDKPWRGEGGVRSPQFSPDPTKPCYILVPVACTTQVLWLWGAVWVGSAGHKPGVVGSAEEGNHQVPSSCSGLENIHV